MIKKYGDLISGSFTILLSIVIFVASGFIKQSSAVGVGAEFMPRIVAVVLFVLGILVSYNGFKIARSYGPIQKEQIKPAYGIMLGSLLLMIIYAALLSKVGFIITSAVYLFLQILLISRKEEVNYIKIAVISICSSIGIFLLFVNAFGIMIPSGILG